MLPSGLRDPEPRWIRFGFTVTALVAILAGAGAAAVADDVELLWWGIRVGGVSTVVSGAGTVVYRDAFAAGVGRSTPRRSSPRYHVVTGTARAFLGVALVLATLT